jgi:penicillin-binding protein 1C
MGKNFLLQCKLHLFKYKLLYFIIIIILGIYYFLLPKTLFPCDYSTVVFDRDGELLGARITSDGQWRFPSNDSVVSNNFKECLIEYEDRYFYRHPGFNPVSLFRAMKLNIRAGRIVSGGSTISMQVIRLFRNHKNRTFWEKLIEIIFATRLEMGYSKKEILSAYYNHAPFGGNVVGVQAASWRFFGRSAQNLSWSEAALLSVLPNSPSSIHLSKNRLILINKRNKLLQKIYKAGKISYSTYQLSLMEPLPDEPFPIPDMAPHITAEINANRKADITVTTLSKKIQQNTSRLVSDYMDQLMANEISNACVLIIDVNTSEILAYVANVPKDKFKVDGQDVDLIKASRSTGSILKPVLYAAMQCEGTILPGTLIPDIPTTIAGFKPENYDLGYDGAVPAKMALSRSLNIPCVRLLQRCGIPKFQNLLTNLGITTLNYPSDRYGLTLIVGGAEAKLFDIAGVYSKMAYTLNYYNKINNYPDSIPNIHFFKDHHKVTFQNVSPYKYLDAGSIWLTFQALLEVNRPDEENGWAQLSSSRRIAWKTGTSYGFRDAWAVGTTPGYVVAVWVGNADGEGRPGLTGVGVAAPLMFRVFASLPGTSWFKIPYDELEKIPVCRLSGHKAGEYCSPVDTIWADRKGLESDLCPYHKLLHLSADKKYRVSQDCYPKDNIINEPWFLLPPSMEWFYRKKNVFYKQLPPLKPGCLTDDQTVYMEFIYPSDAVKIFIPKGLDGTPGQAVFEVAHRNVQATIFWHIDNEYIGSTKGMHQMPLAPTEGIHYITIVDDEGRTLTKKFEVVSSK